MTEHVPSAPDQQLDPRAHTDAVRRHQAVMRNERDQWVLLRHADVMQVAQDPERFSSAVSAHLQLPNGLDGVEHRAARETLDRYFTASALAPYEPIFRAAAKQLVASLPRGEVVDAVNEIGAPFAVRGQSAWLGWPTELEPRLLEWMDQNHAATRSGDRGRTAVVASDFDAIIHSILQPRRELGDAAPDDLTTRLMRDVWNGRPFSDEELVSVLRNWTGGDLGSIALCVGVLVAFLADHPEAQTELRAGATDAELDAVIDEILRIDDPFVSNRRKTTCPVHIGGEDIPEGETVILHWTSANRDAEAFADPDAFDPEGNADKNLVYGTGPHVCPGRPLATMELRIILQELLAGTQDISWAPNEQPEREQAPVGGYARVPVTLR